jgi:hypothetical protein
MANEKVEVGSLNPNRGFSIGRAKYIVSAVYPFAVMAVRLNPTKAAPAVEKLPLDTLVSPVDPKPEPAPEPAPESEPEIED